MLPLSYQYAARRANLSHWERALATQKDADLSIALTGQAEPISQTLSFWQSYAIDDTADIMLALALATARTRAAGVAVIQITLSELRNHSTSIKHTSGHTRVSHLRRRHIDAHVTAAQIIPLARKIAQAKLQNQYAYWTAGKAKQEIANAVQNGIILKAELPEGIAKDITRYLIA